MKQLVPFLVNDATLVSSNVAETDPEFDIEATYGEADVVADPETHHRYESQTDDNTGHSLDDKAYWVDLGMTNRWRMFDGKRGSVTVNAETIDVVLTASGRATGVALFGLKAATVQIVVTDAVEGEVYNETFSMVSQENVNDIYDYFFAPILRRENFSAETLPPYSNAEVRIIISQPGGMAECGEAVLGEWNDLGGTEWGAEYGTIDFSKPKEDAFGNIELKKGVNRPTVTASAECDPVMVDETKRVIDSALGALRVWKINDRSAGLILGFARSSRITDRNAAYAILSVDLESVG